MSACSAVNEMDNRTTHWDRVTHDTWPITFMLDTSIRTIVQSNTYYKPRYVLPYDSMTQLNELNVYVQCESKKNPPRGPDFFHFFHKRLRICNRFFTHLLNVPIFARLQIVIQLSLILTKLCHIKRDYPVHIICAKCPKRAKTLAFRRLRKSLIALLIVICGKSL